MIEPKLYIVLYQDWVCMLIWKLDLIYWY